MGRLSFGFGGGAWVVVVVVVAVVVAAGWELWLLLLELEEQPQRYAMAAVETNTLMVDSFFIVYYGFHFDCRYRQPWFSGWLITRKRSRAYKTFFGFQNSS